MERRRDNSSNESSPAAKGASRGWCQRRRLVFRLFQQTADFRQVRVLSFLLNFPRLSCGVYMLTPAFFFLRTTTFLLLPPLDSSMGSRLSFILLDVPTTAFDLQTSPKSSCLVFDMACLLVLKISFQTRPPPSSSSLPFFAHDILRTNRPLTLSAVHHRHETLRLGRYLVAGCVLSCADVASHYRTCFSASFRQTVYSCRAVIRGVVCWCFSERLGSMGWFSFCFVGHPVTSAPSR